MDLGKSMSPTEWDFEFPNSKLLEFMCYPDNQKNQQHAAIKLPSYAVKQLI
jgi:hypothetical protein